MNREEILSMPAGRELDALVAEKVMGLTLHETYKNMYLMESGRRWDDVPHYSTDISAAWEVVEKFKQYEIGTYMGKVSVAIGDPGYYVQAKKAPEAICKSALLAVME